METKTYKIHLEVNGGEYYTDIEFEASTVLKGEPYFDEKRWLIFPCWIDGKMIKFEEDFEIEEE